MLSVIQIAPIKINPWTWLAKKIGRAINGDVIERLNEQAKEIKSLHEKREESEATTRRYRILRFDDEIRHEKKHTKEHFDQVLDDIMIYNNYCKSHPDYKNNKAVMAIENIETTYRKCAREHTFL